MHFPFAPKQLNSCKRCIILKEIYIILLANSLSKIVCMCVIVDFTYTKKIVKPKIKLSICNITLYAPIIVYHAWVFFFFFLNFSTLYEKINEHATGYDWYVEHKMDFHSI